MIDEGFEAACRRKESFAADGERGAEAEVDAAFDEAGGEDSGGEVGGDAEGFEDGAEGPLLSMRPR